MDPLRTVLHRLRAKGSAPTTLAAGGRSSDGAKSEEDKGSEIKT